MTYNDNLDGDDYAKKLQYQTKIQAAPPAALSDWNIVARLGDRRGRHPQILKSGIVFEK